MQRGRSGENDRVDVVAGQHPLQVAVDIRHAMAVGELLGLFEREAHHGVDHRVLDRRQGVEMLGPERSGSDERDPYRPRHVEASSTM